MKKPPIDEYIRILLHDPTYILACFLRYYEKLNVPFPSKAEILNNMMELTGNGKGMTDKEQEKTKQAFSAYIDNIIDSFKNVYSSITFIQPLIGSIKIFPCDLNILYSAYVSGRLFGLKRSYILSTVPTSDFSGVFSFAAFNSFPSVPSFSSYKFLCFISSSLKVDFLVRK